MHCFQRGRFIGFTFVVCSLLAGGIFPSARSWEPAAAVPLGERSAEAAVPSLRELAAARGLRIGAAINSATVLTDATYADTLRREFDMAVSENAMKWGPIHPDPDTFATVDPDAQVAFAEANGMAFRGHTLAWHNQNPPWLVAGPFTREQRIEQLRSHIAAVVGRYKGRVAQWDVVNEAFDGLVGTRDPWSVDIGFPEYLDIAFTAAHEADPAAKLFYNDYAIETPGPRFEYVVDLVAGMQARGVPIHGVGLQAHQGARACTEACANAALVNMVRLNEMGLEVAITELDVAIQLPVDEAELADQASVYRSLLQACLLAPNCHTFVLWGFTDNFSWIPSFRPGFGAALPFDEAYQPKPAYFALAETLADPPTGPACSNFATQAGAQVAFDSGTLGAPLLDPDGDGLACETLSGAVTPSTISNTPPVVVPVFTG